MLQNMQMEELEVGNSQKLNFYQVMAFIFKIKEDTAPAGFPNNFQEISYRYPAGFSQSNFIEGNILSIKTKFALLS